MSNRDTWCRHRTPFTVEYPTCKVGVDFHEFDGGLRLMPCLGETAEAKARCPQYSGYTAEEIEAHEKETEDRWTRMATIRKAIIEDSTTRKVPAGRIPCPACKTGSVAYSRASNGHVHAKCSTPNCAIWME